MRTGDREYGYALRGDRAAAAVSARRGKRLTGIACVCCDGVLDFELFER